mgnify:CR=1 FL=1
MIYRMNKVFLEKRISKGIMILFLIALCSCGGGSTQNNVNNESSSESESSSSNQNPNDNQTSLLNVEMVENRFGKCNFGECKFE